MSRSTRDGAALRLDAGATLSSPAAVLQAQEQVFDLLGRGLPVAITIGGLCGDLPPEVLFVRACKVLQRALLNAGCASEAITIVLDAGDLAPQFAVTVRSAILGRGVVYLLPGRQLLRPAVEARRRQRQERFWLQSWHLRNDGRVASAFAPGITSPCPLFDAEDAIGILPPYGLQVPPGTAWVVAEVDLADSVGSNGEINEFAMRERLRCCVDYGEQLHDEGEWPTAAMRQDSWSNRRLAISIVGVGDLVKRQGVDPQSLAALQSIDAVLHSIRETVDGYSRELAAAIQPAPGLALAAEVVGDSGVAGMAAWRTRWQAAMQFAATRHRNLLTMSPWAMFPRGEPADFRYCDLLPVLAFADSCSFLQRPCLGHWNVNEFKHFHQRAWAILERKNARQMIAEQV